MEGRSVVIAGGAGGLGRATARLVAERGARVALIDVSAEALEDCSRELTALLAGAGPAGSPGLRHGLARPRYIACRDR